MVNSAVGVRGRLSVLPLLAAALAGCQFSFSAGGIDYEKLEGAITDELNSQYAQISREVTNVDCPRQEASPNPGDTFNCIAELDGHQVRVGVTVQDEDYNVDFSTLDVVFELADTAQTLAREISAQFGFDVSVSCGDGLKVVAVGESFDCTATDPSGDTRTVKLTAGAVGENDSWELVD